MILIVTPSARAEECIVSIRQATNEDVVVAESLRKAVSRLQTESYLTVVLDQFLLETEPHETDAVMDHLGAAIPLQVNFAICSADRLVREVRTAVQRRHREEAAARREAANILQSELNGTVTALLLSCELALGAPDLPEEAVEKLQTTYGLVKRLRAQLESHTTAP